MAGLQDSSPIDTPLELNVKCGHEEGDLLSDQTLFRQLVGILNYLTTTRSDISFAVQHVSQFMYTPRRIIKYFLGSPNRGLFFPVGSRIQFLAFVMLIGLDVRIVGYGVKVLTFMV